LAHLAMELRPLARQTVQHVAHVQTTNSLWDALGLASATATARVKPVKLASLCIHAKMHVTAKALPHNTTVSHALHVGMGSMSLAAAMHRVHVHRAKNVYLGSICRHVAALEMLAACV
jgi:hypothetical protein